MPDEEAAGGDDISPADYAAFIEQIQLVAVWLQRSRTENRYGPTTPDRAVFDVESRAEWRVLPEGFRCLHTYQVAGKTADQTLAEIEVTFAVDFDSKQGMTDAIFDLFREVNLPVNTWPYLREFVASTLGRFGWTSLTLPAFKVGTRPARRTRARRGAGGGRNRRRGATSEEAG